MFRSRPGLALLCLDRSTLPERLTRPIPCSLAWHLDTHVRMQLLGKGLHDDRPQARLGKTCFGAHADAVILYGERSGVVLAFIGYHDRAALFAGKSMFERVDDGRPQVKLETTPT